MGLALTTSGGFMIKQFWKKLFIKTDDQESVKATLMKSKKVRNISITDNGVSYENLTWSEE